MSEQTRARATIAPIHVIDTITIAPHRRDEFLRRLAAEYLPIAARTGLRQVRSAIHPPVDIPDEPSHLVVWWELDDVDALWERRRRALDGAGAAFWRAVAALVLERRRRYCAGVELA